MKKGVERSESADSGTFSSSPCSSGLADLALADRAINSSTISQIKKIRNVRKSDIHKCAVCGDRPSGYHYDVLSCNGCKTFFRRTIVTRRKFICSKDGNCQFSKDFRCACRACRFAKCVKVGMNPDSIQSPTDSDSDEIATVIRSPLQTEELDKFKILKTIMNQEMAVKSIRNGEMPLFIYPDYVLDSIVDESCSLTRRGMIGSAPEEREAYQNNPAKYWIVADLFLTVEFAKTFKEFRNFTKKDKKELLYNIGATVQIFSQSYYSLEYNSDCVTFPDGINTMVLKRGSIRFDFKKFISIVRSENEEYIRDTYCRPVDILRKLNLTPEEFSLFKSIALFSNETDLEPKAQKIVQKKREELLQILRRYLIGEYGIQGGLEKLAHCLYSLKTFMDIAEKRRNFLFCVDLMKLADLSNLTKCIYLRQELN